MEETRSRQLQYVCLLGGAITFLYYNRVSDMEFWHSFLLSVPGFFIVYNTHVQHVPADSWWTNWAFHKLLSLLFVLYFGFRMTFVEQKRHTCDLGALSLYFYTYHVTGDVEL